MKTVLTQSLIVLACLAQGANALAKGEDIAPTAPTAPAAAAAPCLITAKGVDQTNLGDTFKRFKARYPDRLGVDTDPDTMTKYLLLFNDSRARANDQRSDQSDFKRASLMVFFDGYDVDEKEDQLKVSQLALPRDDQKINRIQVLTPACQTAEGLSVGMRVKEAAKRHGGIKAIEGFEDTGELVQFVNHPEGFIFSMEGAVFGKDPAPEDGKWSTKRYRPDAKLTRITVFRP